MLLSFLLIVNFSCLRTNSVNKKQEDSNKTTEMSDTLIKTTIIDSCKLVTTNFLDWYKSQKNHLDTLYMIRLDNKGFYRVNFENVSRYLFELEESNYFSNNYLNQLKNYIYECDARLVKTKQSDGPPEDLEGDLILKTQEPEVFLLNIDKLNIIKDDQCKEVILSYSYLKLRILFNEEEKIEFIEAL